MVLALSLAVAVLAPSALDGGTDTFGPGEQISYKVSWLGISAGTAQVTMGAELPGRPGIFPIVTFGRADLAIYPIRNKVVSLWDPAARASRGLDLFSDENHKRRRTRIEFLPDDGRVVVTRQVESEPPRESKLEVPASTTDVAGAVFVLRARPLAVGDEIAFPIFTGSKLFQGHARVEERTTLETALGPRTTLLVRLRTEFSGKLAAREVRMWFTDDATHVPVRMEADFALGAVVVEWTDYKPGRPTGPSSLARGR